MSASDLTVSPNIQRLTPCPPGKPLEALERELGRPVIKLGSNENPMGASRHAMSAAAEALRESHRYPEGHRLKAVLAKHHGTQLDELILGAGSNELIDIVTRTFAGAVRHAVYPDPSFVVYAMSCSAANMSATEVPLRDHLHYDVDALLDAVTPQTGLLFLANPNNPTGAHLGRDDLTRLLREVPAGVLVVLDEAYVEFPDAEDFVSALELRELRENLLVLRTFSKAFGLAALRVGYGIAPARIIALLDRVRAPYNVSSPALAAAAAALSDLPHVTRYVELNRAERRRVAAELERIGLFVAPSQANFVLVNVARDARLVADRLLQRGVLVRNMGGRIAQWVRISIGLPEENDRMLSELVSALKD